MSFDYFYNREAEQYIHYTMPKMFFFNERLRSLSVNAKFLYAILLDRAKLSYKNGFVDEDGKVYLHFAQADVMRLLNCGRTKVSEYFSELDEPKGVGLIERKQKVNIGKSDRIYIKNFARPIDDTCRSSEDKAPFSRFAYFHDMENLRFENYQVPKTLFFDEHISKISNIAKMAYSLMLDRTKLSISKNWKDKDGRIYIIFPQKELQEVLGCSLKTVNSALKELDTKSGVGLIERIRQGMNNPDIIYVLDYSTDLKYKPETQSSSEPDSHDIQSVNIGDVKSEHREMQTVNIGSVKTEHREVQNLNIGSVKSEHHYNNNTDFIDTDSIDTQSINQSVSSETVENNQVTKEMIDRLIDDKSNDNSFAEVLTAIGSEYSQYVQYGEAENEMYFENYSETDRKTQQCKIPYIFATDKKKMQQALKFLFAYSYNVSDMEKSEKDFLDSVIKALTELAAQEKTKAGSRCIKYNEVIDAINKIVRNTSLMDFYGFNGFKEHWEKILANKAKQRTKISNIYGLMKSCLANFLIDYDVCSSADEMQANGLFREEFGDSLSVKKTSKSDMGFYSEEIENFSEIKTVDTSGSDKNTDIRITARQTDEPECDSPAVNEPFETSSHDNGSQAQSKASQEQPTPDIDVAAFLARLRGETAEQKQAELKRKEEISQNKIRNAMFFKEIFEERNEPLPDWVKEALAVCD